MKQNSLPEESQFHDIPKQSLHHILHYLMMEKIYKSKHPSTAATLPAKRHPHFLFQYHKNFQLVSKLRSSALALLQTKYAIKPRNPE